MGNQNNRFDPLCVSCDEIADIIDEFITEFRRLHPADEILTGKNWTFGSQTERITPQSPIQLIVERSGLSETVISRIKNRKLKYVGLDTADRILSAMDMGYRLLMMNVMERAAAA